MTSIVKKEDRDFITRFLSVYKGLSEENQNLVLAFVQGMELQRNLDQRPAEPARPRPSV